MTKRDAHGDRTAPAPSARVKQQVTLRFDEFGWESLEAQAERDGVSLDESLARAGAYLCGMLPTTRLAALAPRFKPRDSGTPREVSVELTHGCWESLDDEAARRGIPREQLLEHAALLHLSDSDSGRLADHILDRAIEADDVEGAGGEAGST